MNATTPKLRPTGFLLPIIGDVTQFAAFFLILGVCLPAILPIAPLPLSRVVAFGLTFGVMKSVARIFSREWTTKIPIWRRVEGEQWLLPCFVLGLLIAGEVTPPAVDLGNVKIKPAEDNGAFSQIPSITVLIARLGASLSYALGEAKSFLVLLASVTCEAGILLAGKFLFNRKKPA